LHIDLRNWILPTSIHIIHRIRVNRATPAAGNVPRTRVSAALRLRSRLLDVYRYATTDTNRFPHSSDTKMGEQGGIYVLDGEL
jgi:hypothetical protein